MNFHHMHRQQSRWKPDEEIRKNWGIKCGICGSLWHKSSDCSEGKRMDRQIDKKFPHIKKENAHRAYEEIVSDGHRSKTRLG